jgi:hypothetical protein
MKFYYIGHEFAFKNYDNLNLKPDEIIRWALDYFKWLNLKQENQKEILQYKKRREQLFKKRAAKFEK